MLANIRNLVKGILSKEQLRKLRPFYHGPRAWLAAAFYGFPAKKLKLIGVTGTKGKTTTTVFLGRLLNLSGSKAGYISSAMINNGDFNLTKFNSGFTSTGEVLNRYKMSTIDAFKMQKTLKKMVQNGCEYAVLEFTSQGLEAGRHCGLDGFNATIFLNLFPEHIDAHGGLENYVKAKAILVQNTRLNGVFVSDLEAAHLDFMLQSIEHRTDIKRVLIDFKNSEKALKDLKEFKFNELEKFKISQSKEGYEVLDYQGKTAETNFLAKFDALNLGFAWVTLLQLGLKPDLLKLSQVWGVPGRMEWVVRNGQAVYRSPDSVGANVGTSVSSPAVGHSKGDKILKQVQDDKVQARGDTVKVQGDRSSAQNDKSVFQDDTMVSKNLSIMVDYAHETESLRQLLEIFDKLKKSGDFTKIIHIFSVTGSGRDVWKRPQMARVTAQISDLVIYTTEDHDATDDLDKMESEVVEYLKQNRAKNILTEQDRLLAFKLAINKAKTEYKDQKVLIVSTAMGSQQGMETAKGVIEWDERGKWLEALEG